MDHFLSAWNDHDADALAKDAVDTIEFIDFMGHFVRGKQGFRDAHARIFASNMALSIMSVSERTEQHLRDDVVLLHSTWSLTGETSRTGEPAPGRSGRLTMAAVSVDDGWKVFFVQNTAIG